MPLIAKIDPLPHPIGEGRVQLHARPYEDPRVVVGDTVFIWTSERSGGEGLIARGQVVRSSTAEFPNKTGPGTHSEIFLVVETDGARPNRSLSTVQIGRYRDLAGPPAYQELARVLYKHAHNKIVSANSQVVEFLSTYFEGN